MNLEHLKIFLAVYRAGSFAPVAADRGVAPSSVSRAVAALEADLQTRLFQRTTRSLAPTEAADAFFSRVAPLVEELESARHAARDDAQGPTGRLRVTASTSFGQLFIAPRLKAFRAAYPAVDLELILSDMQVDLFAERIDLAVRHGRLRDSTMTARRLLDVRYVVVASPAYLAAAPFVGEPADITDHPILGFPYEDFRSSWRFRRRDEVREVMIDPTLVVSNAAALAQCARDGLGLALLADWTVSEDLNAGRLVRVLTDWEATGATFENTIWLVYPSRAFLPGKTRAFADFLIEAAAATEGSGMP